MRTALQSVFRLFAVSVIVGCLNSPTSPTLETTAYSIQDENLDDVEYADRDRGEDRHKIIIANVRAGKYKRAETYNRLIGLMSRWRMTTAPETVRVLAEGFSRLPDDQLTVKNLDLFFTDLRRLGPGHTARAAQVLRDSGRLSSDEISMLDCHVYDVDNPCKIAGF